MTLVELCAGTASVSLWAMGRAVPLTGYMGSKRRWAPQLVEALGVDHPDRVVLVDAGPWGDAWAVLRDPVLRARTAEVLDSWSGQTLTALWAWLVAQPPSQDSAPMRIAQFLWLQARSAGTIPVWWSAEASRWESPTGSRTEAAHSRGGSALSKRQKGNPSERAAGPAYDAAGGSRKVGTANPKAPLGCRGIQDPATIARRIDALSRLSWDRVEVVHADLRTVDPIPGATVYFDPPYLGCPRYAALLPRVDVLAVSQRWADAGCRVAVSEAVDLPLGWTSRPLARREVVTANWPIVLTEQLGLWSSA